MRVFRIPEILFLKKVTFMIDLWDIDEDRRNAIGTRLVNIVEETVKQHGLAYHIRDTRSEPRYCANRMKEIMRDECRKMGLNAPELMSGSFHDSMSCLKRVMTE